MKKIIKRPARPAFFLPPTPPSYVHTRKMQVNPERYIEIVVAGAGGSGCQMISGLVRIDRVLRALGYAGLHVTLYDPDVVSEANLGRQLFYDQEIGIHKAIALIHRWNCAYTDLCWTAVPEKYIGQCQENGGLFGAIDGGVTLSAYDFLVTCVDTGEARRQIYNGMIDGHWGLAPHYWLDMGNETDFGQVCLGEVRGGWNIEKDNPYLPNIIDRNPGAYNGSVAEIDGPSCSAAEALTKQGLFVNDHVARWALQLIWDLLYHGEIRYCGASVNVAAGVVQSWPVPAPTAEQEESAERGAVWSQGARLNKVGLGELVEFLGGEKPLERQSFSIAPL